MNPSHLHSNLLRIAALAIAAAILTACEAGPAEETSAQAAKPELAAAAQVHVITAGSAEVHQAEARLAAAQDKVAVAQARAELERAASKHADAESQMLADRESAARARAEQERRSPVVERRSETAWKVLNDEGDDVEIAPVAKPEVPVDPAQAIATDDSRRGRNGSGSDGRGDDQGGSPSIDDVWPAKAPVSGGEQVVIRGKNIRAAQVLFGMQPARILAVSDDAVTVMAPPSKAGPAPIVVTNRDGGYAITQFQYYQ